MKRLFIPSRVEGPSFESSVRSGSDGVWIRQCFRAELSRGRSVDSVRLRA